MKQSEAELILRVFMRALQRYRDQALGTIGLNSEIAGELWPWTLGDKCPLPAIAKVLNRAESKGVLPPLDYYNLMIVLTRFMPEVLVGVNIMLLQSGLKEIEDPPVLIIDWDPEEDKT